MSPGVRRTASALLSTTVGVMPVFLFGGLAPLIRADLSFPATWIGTGVAIFFAASSLASVHGGRLGERLGSLRALQLGVLTSSAVLLGIAVLAHDRVVLSLLLALGGVANAIIQPAANLALARGVDERRRGLAFGFKQSAIPTATALGGFAVPLLGVTLGWRAAFVVAGVVALAALAVPVADAPLPDAGGPPGSVRMTSVPASLLLLTVGIGLGSAAANSMSAYLVEAAVDSGWSPGAAGTILGLAGLLGIASRIGVGWYSDRMTGGRLNLVAGMAAVGALGYLALAGMHAPILLAVGVALAFAAGWGYNGLFLFAVVRLHPATPASATGVTQAGAFAGAVVGPPAFGWVAQSTSYAVAWSMLAVLSALTAASFAGGRRRVLAERAA